LLDCAQAAPLGRDRRDRQVPASRTSSIISRRSGKLGRTVRRRFAFDTTWYLSFQLEHPNPAVAGPAHLGRSYNDLRDAIDFDQSDRRVIAKS